MGASMPAAPAPTEPRALDEAVARLREAAPGWAAAPLAARAALARAMLEGVGRTARRAVEAACAAKGLPSDAPQAGEEWLSGPYVTARILRQLERSLTLLARNGNTPVGKLSETVDGRLSVQVFPLTRQDRLLLAGVRAEAHLVEGMTEERLHETRARFHKAPDHQGKVCLVLGAGNINSIPAVDVAGKLFNEGKVCVLKMNPVNAYLGPILEDAFSPAIARGLLAIVYGGAEVGSYLAHHRGVDEVHITGSDRTHDAIVWGPPGPERDARRSSGTPLLAKEITSELGNVSPVLVVPGPWDAGTLRFQAESVAGMVTYNASFNCNAAKMLVLPRGWRRRDAFLAAVEHFMALSPARRAWYPGAADRYRALTEGRAAVRRVGQGEGALPWTLVTGLDADSEDPAFVTEPFCSILSETAVGSEDPVDFLEQAVAFANDRLWGTLAAHIVVHPRTLADPSLEAALQRAIRRLRYGTVAVNTWAGYGYGLGTAPWGAFPGSTLEDVQSGRGFVHNTVMLEGVEKVVVWHPARTFPKPPYFPSHATTDALGRSLVRLETRGRWRDLPAVVLAGIRG
ncbi:aldehyde dehydrogenase family protein [Anaeromyxobacter dehalogenans]|nr:aldehyde dehydrogenase family protein [Anaeromyxobacter dehalogenans]